MEGLATQAGGLGAHGVAMLAATLVVFAMFVRDRVPMPTICLAILTLLPLGFVLFPLQTADGPVDPMRFFAGLGHPALVAICGLMVLGHGLVVTGALEPVAHRLAGWVALRPRLALLALLVFPAAISGLVNDTPVVVLLIPLIIAAARRAKVASSSMLLPMNYAVLIGGMATTIGTSTNLIVVALAAGLGVGPFGVLSFYSLVLAAALPALLYLWLAAPRMLARREAEEEALTAPVFDAELHVEAGAWLDGRALHEVFAATGRRLYLRDIRRGSQALARLPSLTLRAGDRLRLQDTAENLKEFETLLKARLHAVDVDGIAALAVPDDEAESGPSSAVVAQMIVMTSSPLAGATLRQRRVAEQYGIVVVGLRPREALHGWERVDLPARTIHSGDILLVQGEPKSIQAAQADGIGLLLDERFAVPRQEKARLALLVMGATVLLAATKMLPIALAALGGVLALLATRCLSWKDVIQSLSVKVVLLVTASLALGDALELTGATAYLAGCIGAWTMGLSPSAVLLILMGLMGLLTNFVSNNAAAAIGTPLGIELARVLGVPPEAFVLAVLFGCNLCYLTPMGYQTNLLVMKAGNYRFADFTRVGLPLFLIMWLSLSYGLVWRYGL